MNPGQLPFEFWIPRRNCVARSWAFWNFGPSPMDAKAVGSRAGCDDDDNAAHPPLGNCFCANTRRRSPTETLLVVTIALLYGRLPILSNCDRRKPGDSATGPATRQKRVESCSPPKVQIAKIRCGHLRRCVNDAPAGATTTQAEYGNEISCVRGATRKVHSGRKCRHPDYIRPGIFLTFHVGNLRWTVC